MTKDSVKAAKLIQESRSPIIFELFSYHFMICGTRRIPAGMPAGALVDKVRSTTTAAVQALDADYVFGISHAIGLCAIAVEAMKRGIMIANKIETEILVRFALSAQISDAIIRTGIRPGRPACFVAVSQDREEILRFSQQFVREAPGGEVDNSVLDPSLRKMRAIMAAHSWKKSPGSDIFTMKRFGDFLCERAAIMVM